MDTPKARGHQPSFMRVIGSLWFAAVLLMLLLVAMACATVFESQYGAERALATFYRTNWFRGLLGLLSLNVLAAMVVRFPFGKKQIGFVITHVAILVTLGGALTTKYCFIDGQTGVVEGGEVTEFTVPDDTLTLYNRIDRNRTTIDLNTKVFSGFREVENPEAPALINGSLTAHVSRYLPDSKVVTRMANDNPRPRLALEVSLSVSGEADPGWIFAGDSARRGPTTVAYRVEGNAGRLQKLLGDQPVPTGESKGSVVVKVDGTSFNFSLEQCMDKPVPIGQTGLSLLVTRYLPHATVGANNKLENTSDKPINPAIEAEITGPDGPERRIAYAKFPDFTHGVEKYANVDVKFIMSGGDTPLAPIELIDDMAGQLYVRYSAGTTGAATPLAIGDVVDTPWPGMKLAVLRRFTNARKTTTVEPVTPVRKKGRKPAIQVGLISGQDTSEMWLQKNRPYPLTVDGQPFEIMFGRKSLPLGFTLKLDKFTLGTYPGTTRPRSFESVVTLTDPTTGISESRKISMNHPTKFGGYKLFQSSYFIDDTRTISYLSVSRDPGQIIVFAGYIMMIGGMIIVLITRMIENRPVRGRPAVQ